TQFTLGGALSSQGTKLGATGTILSRFVRGNQQTGPGQQTQNPPQQNQNANPNQPTQQNQNANQNPAQQNSPNQNANQNSPAGTTPNTAASPVARAFAQ